MSKANQKFVQADEAVSPVIGVILMVAITVVLAAVVFVLVSNLSKSGQKAPDVAFSTDETRDRFTLVTAQNELQYSDFVFKSSAAVQWVRNANAATGSTLDGTYTEMNIGNGASAFEAGDYWEFCGLGGNIDTPTSFQVRHIDSNTVVYEGSLNTIQAC
ncbi:MAG: type IV pilin N-terminal domain-containing protein [Candidatus Thermoplasmatota archaeon]|mgnify:CR=1 FL=1